MVSADSTRHFPVGTHDIYISPDAPLDENELKPIATMIEAAIAKGSYPGAIILAGNETGIFYRGVFGNQSVTPHLVPMQANTIFDVASLTKVIVTTTAVMQLTEQGLIDVDAPVAKYWPEFAANGKAEITVRDLLTHTSGLPVDIGSPELNRVLPESMRDTAAIAWSGKAKALQQIIATKPLTPRAEEFLYGDINFIVLGLLVEIISQQPLEKYADEHIFKPAGMNDSFFLPPLSLRSRIAPTEILSGKLHWGEVHDPTVNLMGGVAGMAGLFSSAHDLGRFAQILVNHGKIADANATAPHYLLQPETVNKMISPQTPENIAAKRGFGWDINSPLACRGNIFSPQSFGHTGWTGTSMWIDPLTRTWLIILTSRTHPTPAAVNPLIQDRKIIADAVGRAVRQKDKLKS